MGRQTTSETERVGGLEIERDRQRVRKGKLKKDRQT